MPAVILLLAVILQAGAAEADERILSFRSSITVNQDSTMTVTETIRVRAEGAKIRRGIYRDFPTRYTDSRGNSYVVGFSVIGVTRDGAAEPYHVTGLSNGERVYIGEKDTFLSPGEYTYTLTYTTDHQLGFFQDFDELYWNVTGNGWVFTIETASAEIHLPSDAGEKIISTAAYTGPQGAKGKDYSEERLPAGPVVFSTTRPLGAFEGMTVAVSWPKGYVVKPPARAGTGWEKWFLPGRGSSYATFGIFVLAGYYLLVWLKAGRDPEPGHIVVRYTPPSDMTPAVMRYIVRMGYDDKGFAAALINLAVKGHIALYEEDGEYRVKKTDGGKTPLPAEERKVLEHLLGAQREIMLIKRNHAYIGGAVRALGGYLKQKYEKIYFVTNSRYFIAGLLITALLLLSSGFSLAKGKNTLSGFIFICVWLTIWSGGVIALVLQTVGAWKTALRGGNKAVKGTGAVFITLFSLPFIAGEIGGMVFMSMLSSVMVVVFLVVAMAVNYLFYHLLKAPTRAGRTVLDGIEGFRVFLDATGKDRLNMLNPPEQTPEVFERYLPYALALDVEQQWAEQFSSILSGAAAGGGYQPSWYHGASAAAFSAATFAGSIGDSLAGAVSSSSTAPGSSSGSSGGGSSGGGGGGGGGGGW